MRGGVVGEALFDQRRQARYMGRRLACSREPALLPLRAAEAGGDGSGGYLSACRAGDVGLGRSARRWALAAVARNRVGVPVVGRSHREHAGVGAFRRIAHAAARGGVCQVAAKRLELRPARSVSGYFTHRKSVCSGYIDLDADGFARYVAGLAGLGVVACENVIPTPSGVAPIQLKFKARIRGSPAVVPAQLECDAFSRPYRDGVDKIGSLKYKSGCACGKAAVPCGARVVSGRVDEDYAAGDRGVHAFEGTVGEWGCAVAGAVPGSAGYRVVDDVHILFHHPVDGVFQVAQRDGVGYVEGRVGGDVQEGFGDYRAVIGIGFAVGEGCGVRSDFGVAAGGYVGGGGQFAA